jgi:hypothetical protein
MNLPNYFLADLPPQAELTEAIITEACQTLKRNRERYLECRTTAGIMGVIVDVAQQWLRPGYPFREMVFEQGPGKSGFSRETLLEGLDRFFAQITSDNLHRLILQDLGHLQRMEGLQSNDDEQRSDRASMARGPELLVHITGGCLPNPALTSMLLGLLVRSAQFVKCASGTAFIPRLFAHSLYEADPKLASCLEVAEWKGGTEPLEAALFAEANGLTATGSNESLMEIQKRLPPHVRFIGHGHRVSFGYVCHEALSGMQPQKCVSRAAADVIAWDQLGCLSPHLLYVETGGKLSPEQFAAALAGELARLELIQPRGSVSLETSANIASRRAFYEVRAAHSSETKMWASRGSTAWTVIYEADPQFQLSCLNRFIYVKAVADLKQALQGADAVRDQVSTVGIAAPEHRAAELANALARWGVTRVCPLGQMQNPPFTWRHDGRPSLGDLITWTDWEL